MINNAPKIYWSNQNGTQSIFDQYPAYQPLVLQCTQFLPPTTAESPGPEQLLAAGWGYCTWTRIDSKKIMGLV